MSNSLNTGLNYICFTTIPSRFRNIKQIINYIKKNFKGQYHCINIYIPISYIRFGSEYTIPKWIKNIDGVNVIKCEKDWGPATKFIGPILDKNIKNTDNIIVIDDDNIKDLGWLCISNYYLNKFPNSVIQLRVSSHTNTLVALKVPQIHGVSGFCFKKKTLNRDALFKFIEELPQKFLFIDDDILTYFLHLYKINIAMSNEMVQRKYLFRGDALVGLKGELNRKNLRNNANKYFYEKYKLDFNLFNIV